MRPDIGSEAWHRNLTAAIQDAIERLAEADLHEFEAVLREVLGRFSELLDAGALGESAPDGQGVVWYDPTLISLDQIRADGAHLLSLPHAEGPFSFKGSSGHPITAVPARSVGFSRFTAALAGNRAPLGVEATRALGLLNTVVGAARQRVVAERSLQARVERQALLNEISLKAASEEPDVTTLAELLDLARASMGVTAVTTLALEGGKYLIVASTDLLGRDAISSGTSVDADTAEIMATTNAGHLVRDVEGFVPQPDSFQDAVGQVLVIPRFSSEGVDGMVVFTDLGGREWGGAEVEAGKAISRSIQKLAERAEAHAVASRRHSLDLMLAKVASSAATLSVENFDAVVTEAMTLAIDTFEIAAAGIWMFADDRATRVIGATADASFTRAPMAFPFDRGMLDRLTSDGHAFISTDSLEVSGSPLLGDYRTLSVPIGPVGMIVLSYEDRWWSPDEIAAAKTLATLADHTRVRLLADAALLERLRSEALISAVAGAAVDSTLENQGATLDRILSDVAAYFGVVEASAWSSEGSVLRCLTAVRTDELAPAVGWEIPNPALGGFAAGEWSVTRMGALDLGENIQHDPDDTKVLIVGFGGTKEAKGALVLTDYSGRWWTEDKLGTARAVADVVGQLQLRMDMAEQLADQRRVEAILAAASSELVNATIDDAEDVVARTLEVLRAHLGLAGITLLELDNNTLEIHAKCEVTDDGLPLLVSEFPISRDHPSVARMLDPGSPKIWTLNELFAVDSRARHQALVNSAVSGRDVLFLVAASRTTAFSELEKGAMSSLIAILAQLRRRLLLEIRDRRRREADALVGAIARSFVEQPPHSHEAALEGAFQMIGEFCGMQAIGQWDLAADGSARRVLGWNDPVMGMPLEAATGYLDADHLLARSFQSVEENSVRELTGRLIGSGHADGTSFVQRLSRPGFGEAVLAGLVPRPMHLVPDTEIFSELLGSVARLMEQLWRRADADLTVTQQLHFEDLLRQFATRLVTVTADAPELLEDAFGDLVDEVGVDQAKIWHFQPTAEGFDVSSVLHVAGSGVGPLSERDEYFSVPAGFTDPDTAPHFSTPATAWSLDELAAANLKLLAGTMPPGPRQVAFFPAPGADPLAEASYLQLSRPGEQPFRSVELEFFKSAYSILIQHQSRVAAERYFSAAFNSAPVGISLREADLTFIHCNQAYCELVGRSVEELGNTTLHDIMPPEMAEKRSVMFTAGFEVVEYESSYRRPDGTIRWAAVRTTPVKAPGRRTPLLLTYAEDITERRRNREMLEYQATHDELTGLPNRRALVADITAELANGECAVLVLDLDRFKVVNDSLGHSVGDQLLITCADRIRLSLRPGDAVCRLGGDEFAILLRAPADQHAAGVVAERLLTLLREPVTVGDDEVFPSASIGVAIPQAGDTVEDLLRHADAAMYQAKGAGRDRWDAFDGSMRQAVVDRIRTETDLRRAIDNGQLEVHYQPEFLLETGEIVGTEALVRWRHPERGLLAAGSFISLAEETGLVVDLGRWVLGRATLQGAQWLADGHDIITRVNLSARQLRGAVVAEVQEALAAANLPANRLCLELTETAIMDDVQESARILAQFRELGVQVAIDDFGTGFSSLAYLKRFPVDILKIDRTFVDGVGVDPDDTAIVRSVIGLARTLRLEVVAEGIEDAAQVGELVRLGCSRGQGFHLARPAPADDVSMLLAGNRAQSGNIQPE